MRFSRRATLFMILLDAAHAQMTIVNAAFMEPGQALAPGSFASVFGENLCSQTAAADWIAPGQLPPTLGGCSVTVGGAAAMIEYVSPGQINFVVPASAGMGTASVMIHNGSGMMNGSMTIGQAGPGMFSLSGMGMGEGAMLHGTMWTPPPFSVTTNGQTTPVTIYVTGLDLTTKPVVSIAGVPAEVTWWGDAPGFAGLQQININLPASAAGAGRVPVTVTSDGVTSNVTFMSVLPANGMMAGMPGMPGSGMGAENMPRGHEMAYLAFNAANGTALVTDENDDVVRVIAAASGATTATITLPSQSTANAIAVDGGQYAAVALSAKAAVALLDLAKNQVAAVIGTGYYPSHVVFAGPSLLVTNGASSTVSVIDVASRAVTHTVSTGFGPSGIAVSGNTAVVANMQAGSLSLINLTDYSVSSIALPPGSRPHEVAVSSDGQAVVSNPMSNGILLVDLASKKVTAIDTGVWNAMGPGAVVTNGSLAYVANQMTSSVTVLDLKTGTVVKTFVVDPGPRAMAVSATKNQLLVLAEGTGTLDVVDLATLTVTSRFNAGETERQGTWMMPVITSISPRSAAAGTAFTLNISGSGLQGVKDIEFHFGSGVVANGGMMGSSGMRTMGGDDSEIKASNIQVNAAGTQLTAAVQIAGSASAGPRLMWVETTWGYVMGMMPNAGFTVSGK